MTAAGVDLIQRERHRQVFIEGWSADHDLEHPAGVLTRAAECYARAARLQLTAPGEAWETVPDGWPWAPSWWKPSEVPSRNLVKAGALIAAELDREARAAT